MSELVGAHELADLLGVSRPQGIHEWRRRHADFPEPVATLEMGMLWLWPEVRAWAISTGRLTADGEPIKQTGGRPRQSKD